MELKDPGKNRKINTTPMPYQRSLSQEQLFPNDTVDHKILLKFYKREGKLSKKLYQELLKRAKHIFSTPPRTQRKKPTSSRSRTPSPSSATSTDSSTISSKFTSPHPDHRRRHWRTPRLHQVHLPGRLRRPRLLLHRSAGPHPGHQDTLQKHSVHAARQPRVPTTHFLLQLPLRMYPTGNSGLAKYDQ